MTIILVGLNHRTAPVELRERLTLSDATLQSAFAQLRSRASLSAEPESLVATIGEVVILSTCNRLEVYALADHSGDAVTFLEQFLAKFQNIPVSELRPHLYKRFDDDAAEHLMRVASGLDSMILGETQILGQVGRAYEQADRAGLTGAVFSHLFALAVHAGKRGRAETPVSRYTTSVSHAGISLLVEKLNPADTARVVIIGAGEMAALGAAALKRVNIHDIIFVNRTYERAESLAAVYGGKAQTWMQLEEALVWADAVICATGAPHTVLYRRDIEAVLRQRAGRPLVMVDIAVPRDVEHTVRGLESVQLYDIDDLQSVVDINIELRKAAIPQVETIIQQELARFTEWHHSRHITPVIKTLREWAQSIAEDELEQTLNRLSYTDERTRQIVIQMANRLVNRLLHEPTTRLRTQASEGNGYGYAHAVRELFALSSLDGFECQGHGTGCGVVGQAEQRGNPCALQCILPYRAGQ